MNIFYHTNSEEGKSVPSIREAAGEYIDRGWNPVPIGFRSKKPSAGDAWQTVKIDHSNVDQYFNGAPQNIGVQMGPASGGLVDVDLDSPEALALAWAILPPTAAVFGRKSTPGAHHIYVADAEIVNRAAVKFEDPNRDGDEALLLELRVGGAGKGAQTVFPPSEHKGTGELICWEKTGEPARVVGRDLLRQARLLAVCCLLARYWPATGSGCHDAALVVGGLLARAGLGAEEIRHLVAAVTNFQNPARSDDLPRTAADAATGYLKGERTYGFPLFAKTFGEDVAKPVAEWLEYSSASGTSAGAEKRAFEDWPEPTPLPSGLLSVSALEPLMLPNKLAPWLQDIGDRMQIPLDFLGMPAMAVYGSAIGCKVGIRPKRQDDWTEVANLWVIIIARPGFMKSPAVGEVLKPVHFMMHAAAIEYSSQLKEYELDADIYKHRRSKAIKAEGGERFTDPAPEEPKHRRYITNDSTYEKLCEILRDNPSGVLLHRDEIVSLLRYLDREENSQARGFYLTAWGGTQRYDSDRIARGAIHVDHACLSALGTTQPGVMSEYVRRATGGAGDDGLIQRFNHVWPDTSVEWENVDRYPLKEPRDDAWNAFKRLVVATPDDFGATKEEFDRIPWLRFTPDAQTEFETWREKLEARIRGGDLSLAIESHIAKYRGLVPRLALITHLIDVGQGPVGHEALLKALSLSEYLEAHAARLYAAGAEPARAAAKAILAKIRASALKDGFTARDVCRNHWSGLANPDHVELGLNLLCDHDWIEANPVETGGRPKVEYTINPKGKKMPPKVEHAGARS